MKHHFADFLDRTGNYWTIIPNRERYAYSADDDITDKASVKTLTISKDHRNWKQVFDCPNLEELTLHDATKKQAGAIQKLTSLKRLRITFFRATDLEFIGNLPNLEEIVLEYVSGFSDLSPLRKLTKLRSLYMENLRRVSNFEGLRGIDSLQYLHITGTVDWNQPIENFDFINGLPNLEVFSLYFVTSKAEYPAFLPLLGLQKLKKLNIVRDYFTTNEYAFLQAALPNIEGSNWDLFWDDNDNLSFLGKCASHVKKSSPVAQQRCNEFATQFEELKKEAEVMLKNYHG